ncbi:MAG: universal stress protein [Chloroflexota bacterium]
MFTSAIVPLDGSPQSEASLEAAVALLAPGGAAVLLGVLPGSDLLVPALLDLVSETHVRLALRESIQRQLELAGDRLGDRPVRWSVEVREGDPATEILAAAREHRASFIAMATHGRGAAGRSVFGSIADRVARAATIPVLLVRPGAAPPPFTRIVVPLDGSSRAEAAVTVAVNLADAHHLPVLLVQAVDFHLLAAPVGELALPEVTAGTIAAMREDAGFYLKEVCARFARKNRTLGWLVIEGSPFFAISDALRPGDLLVMTSHGRGGVARWALGSVAEKLVRNAPAPVLLVRSGALEPSAAATGAPVADPAPAPAHPRPGPPA